MELALFIASMLEPDIVLVEFIESSDGFMLTISKFWLVGDIVVSESETIIGLA